MTESSQPQALCEAETKQGRACRKQATHGAFCAFHAGVVDLSAAGKKGRAARGKKGSFREALRRRLESEPERHADKLLSAGASGYKLAAELLELEKGEEQQPSPPTFAGQPVTSMADCVTWAIAMAGEGNNMAELVFGFTPTPEQVTLAHQRWDAERLERGELRPEGVPETHGTPVPSRVPRRPLATARDDIPEGGRPSDFGVPPGTSPAAEKTPVSDSEASEAGEVSERMFDPSEAVTGPRSTPPGDSGNFVRQVLDNVRRERAQLGLQELSDREIQGRDR